MQTHWLGEWWPEHQPSEPIIRAGFAKAIYLSIETGYPLDCYWVCAGHHFEVQILLSRQQVTVLLSTPSPPISLSTFEREEDENIWVTRHASAGYNPLGERREYTLEAEGEHEKDTSGPHRAELKGREVAAKQRDEMLARGEGASGAERPSNIITTKLYSGPHPA
jgi:hypothetical protein